MAKSSIFLIASVVGVVAIALLPGVCNGERVEAPVGIPSVNINLDLAPEDRWTSVTTTLVQTYGWNYTFQPVIDYIHKIVPNELLIIAENLSTFIAPDLPAEMLGEMKGIEAVAQKFGYGDLFPLPLVILMNIIYEMSTACTSIVAMDANNKIWHSRGKTVYQGVTWAGYSGILTGMRPGRFSISIDQRGTNDIFAIIQALRRIYTHKAVPVSFLLRQTLASDIAYTQAVDVLAKTEVSTSIYFIIGGSKALEGAVITRNEQPVAKDVWSMPNGPQPWYVLETNYDHDLQPPQKDDRRDLAIHAMNALGQSRVTAQTLFTVMQTPASNSSRGVFNSETQYTAIMSGSTGYFTGWTWQ